MFGRFRRSAPRPLSDAIQRAIQRDAPPPGSIDPSQLRVVESNGRYADRKVTYFRVFDPASPAQRAVEIRRYEDFDVFVGRILWSGHVEHDGTVVLTRPVTVRAANRPARAQADRALHADDAHIVRGETGASANATASRALTSEQVV